jgi:hypothetical protein
VLASIGAHAQTKDCPHGQYKEKDKDGKEHWKCLEAPLSINITDFYSGFKGDCLVLEWSFNQPLNHSHFEVEYSDGTIWKTVFKSIHTQFIMCEGLKVGYYRLTSVDEDGTKHYYNLIYVPYSEKKYLVYDFYGRLRGEYNNYLSIPRNSLIIVNGNKQLIR